MISRTETMQNPRNTFTSTHFFNAARFTCAVRIVQRGNQNFIKIFANARNFRNVIPRRLSNATYLFLNVGVGAKWKNNRFKVEHINGNFFIGNFKNNSKLRRLFFVVFSNKFGFSQTSNDSEIPTYLLTLTSEYVQLAVSKRKRFNFYTACSELFAT